MSVQRIECDADVEQGLAALLALDSRLNAVLTVAEMVPLRRTRGGFQGLASIIVSQQISKAAADAIWGRVSGQFGEVTAVGLLAAHEPDLKACGLSRPKIRALRAIAGACAAGLDLDDLHDLPPPEALEILTAIKGVGPWTAEVYLLFCCGHADIFPAGDIALQNAVMEAFDLAERPGAEDLRVMAERWSPWRGVAARLFWSYYRARRDGRDATPV